jgi:hypothetical protein
VADLGVDIRAGANDLDPDFSLVEGAEAVAQSQAHRVTTEALWYDPDYECVDLRAMLSAGMDDADLYRLRARCERALRQDERVEDCDVDLNFFPAARTLTVAAEGVSAAGPFRLVVAASAAQSAILEASAR